MTATLGFGVAACAGAQALEGTRSKAAGLKSYEQISRELADVSRSRCEPRATLLSSWIVEAQRAASIAPSFYGNVHDSAGLTDAMWRILQADAADAKENPDRFLRKQLANLRQSIEQSGRSTGKAKVIKRAENLAEMIRTDVAECLAAGGKLADPAGSRAMPVARHPASSMVMGAYVGHAGLPSISTSNKCFNLFSVDGIPIVGSGGVTDIGWDARVDLLNLCDAPITVLLRGRDSSITEVSLKAQESRRISCVRCDYYPYHVDGGAASRPARSAIVRSATATATSKKDDCQDAMDKLKKEDAARGPAPGGTPMVTILQDGLFLTERYISAIEQSCNGPDHLRQKAELEQARDSMLKTCSAVAANRADCVPRKGKW